jgi:prophage tail gpP-like protein
VSFTPVHTISIVVDGQQIRDFESYEINVSMLEPADHFDMKVAFTRDKWELCRPDVPIRVLIDQTVVLVGRIGGRYLPEDEEVVHVTGRCKIGRLVDESAPGINFANLTMFDLIAQVAKPWFETVSFSNVVNRTLIRGRGKKAKSYKEPLAVWAKKKIGTHIEPGQCRWQVIEDLCAQAGVMCWSSGDGSTLIVSEPNYSQEPQFRFFMPKSGTARGNESRVTALGRHDEIDGRYSKIIVVGSGTGTDANYGGSLTSRYGEIKNNPDTPEGDGLDFDAPKRLIVQRQIQSNDEADELAAREMGRRDSLGHWITVRAPAHGQVIGGAFSTLFACDTLAEVEDERTGDKGIYAIMGCTYRGSRKTEETSIHLVRKGSFFVA